MTESQIKEAIVKMNNSEEYLALRKYYSEESFLKTLCISRDEKVHSNFIAWLLSPVSHHELNYFPLEKFLQMLSVVCQKDSNSNARFSNEYAEMFLLGDYELSECCEVNTEVPTGEIAGFDKAGRIDIFINLSFKGSNKRLPIIIENKVLSTENDENTKSVRNKSNKQTVKYFNWAEETFKDKTKYETPILIFLAPDFERDIVCKCDEFIKVSYQNLIDYLIEPCLSISTNERTIYFIEDYLRCLSNSSLNKANDGKERKIMGFSEKEKVLLEKFHEKNKDLFGAVLTILANDEEMTDEDRKKFKAALSAVQKKDYTIYVLDGERYVKRRCVLAVVNKVIEKNNITTFDELVKIFPDDLQGSCGVVKRLSEIKDHSRYFTKNEEILKLDCDVVVCNQWGIENFPNILKIANENGLNVTQA